VPWRGSSGSSGPRSRAVDRKRFPTISECVKVRSGKSHTPTSLNIDDALLKEAVKLSGKRTKSAVVNAALAEFVSRRKQRRILELFGKLEWDSRFDYKKMRKRT
jgi:Arc/MetJ family transcription regulator